jgi:hypothetical protein
MSQDETDRIEMLRLAADGAPAEFTQNALYMEEHEGPGSASVEYTVLFSWISQLIQKENDHSWFDQRLAAIAYRGGPRNKIDEAYLKLKETPGDIAALTAIIREKQLEVANGFFGIHSGAYSFDFAPIPELRFCIHYGLANDDCEVEEYKEVPNAIDEFFFSYATDAL